MDCILGNRYLLYGTVLSVISVLCTIFLAIYRLYFSPLAGFPGNKLAIATGWYEFYFEYFKQGQYVYEIEKMHQKYGPIIRPNAHEIHISDPEFYDQLYVSERVRKVDNYDQFASGIDFEGSHFLTVGHDLHRKRRRPLEPFFSPAGVRRLEPVLWELASKLTARLEAVAGTNTEIRLDHALAAYANDMIRRICWERHDDYLDTPDFGSDWFELLRSIVKTLPMFTGFPWIVRMLSNIPQGFVAKCMPDAKRLLDLQDMARDHIVSAKAEKRLADEKGLKFDERTSLFRSVMNSSMDDTDLGVERLCKEAQVLSAAGTVSTGRTLDFIAFYIMWKPEIRARLQEELREPMKHFPYAPPAVQDLHELPYLRAIIKEGLRLSYGVMHRLPHCAPDDAIQYKEWTIPKNTPVGMSCYMMHSNSEVYVNPKDFSPDRWLGDYNPLMDKYLVAFSLGSRKCIGKHLALNEINVVLSTLFRPGGPAMRLFETTEWDAEAYHDFILPMPRLESKGIRVKVD